MGWLHYTWMMLPVGVQVLQVSSDERRASPLGPDSLGHCIITEESHRRFIQPKVNAYVCLDECTIKMLAFLSGL